MKKILLPLLTLLFFFTSTSKVQVQHFAWQGERDYPVRTPSEYKETTPVLFFLHGLGDNITRLDNEFHFCEGRNHGSDMQGFETMTMRWTT